MDVLVFKGSSAGIDAGVFDTSGDFAPVPAFEGEDLLSVLQRAGFEVSAPCGGNGTCGKCIVDVQRANGAWMRVLACQTAVEPGMKVRSAHTLKGMRVEGAASDAQAATRFPLDAATEGDLGVAVDLGTTTIAAYLFDVSSGELLAQSGEPNPQASFGADVISRIHASSDGALEVLADAAIRSIRNLSRRLCSRAGVEERRIARWSVAGNTVMQHLMCGISPESIGTYPFLPQALFGDARRVPGLGKTFLAPCVSGYVGGDISAGLVACGLDELVRVEGDAEPGVSRTVLFADLGTNGEMALVTGGKLVCCATATGPAFEGANISQGMQAAEGAIDSCRFDGGSFAVTSVGGAEPIGVCGSGLIDALAACLEAGVVDDTGRILARDELPRDRAHLVSMREGKPVVCLTPTGTVALTQKDIRALQLAKAAVAAGITCLLCEAGVEVDDVDEFIIGGAFGAHLRPGSAAQIGLFPRMLLPKVRLVGNCAGAGACAALLSAEARERMGCVARQARYVELSLDEKFSEAYIDAMEFEEAIV